MPPKPVKPDTAAGTAFDRVLEWDDDKGGYIASGFFDWDRCDSITVYVTQGSMIATAQGKPRVRRLSGLKNSWRLDEPLAPIGRGTLKPGKAQAHALAVMSSSGASTADSWRAKRGVTLSERS
jgi:hypothetical protein